MAVDANHTMIRDRPHLTKTDPKQERASVTLSVGLGRLHFMQAAEAIVPNGVDMKVIQGWVPNSFWSDGMIDRLGRLIGSSKLSVGMKKRRLNNVNVQNVGLGLPEALAQILFFANRKFGLKRGTAALLGWSLFGRVSRRHLEGEILHLRSGAGSGGVIAHAHRQGMRVLTDHSIAHPAFLERMLREEYVETPQNAWTTPKDPFWRQVLKDTVEADMLVVNSDFVKSTFVVEGFDHARIHVVYMGVREDFFRLKNNYERTGSTLRILFTGQFGMRKGGRYILKALEALADDGLDFHLTVLGNTSEMHAAVAASRVQDRIHMPGFVPQDELKSYLTDADMYLFPSLAEGCAASAMEALAAGLPVIATHETGLPAKHDQHAIIIPARDAQAIVEAIKDLADDTDKRSRLGTTAARLISENYTWAHYGRNMNALYHEMIDGPNEAR